MAGIPNAVIALAAGLSVAACGGGGTGRVSSTPAPVPAPTPAPAPPPTQVTFMAKPGSGEFTQVATGLLMAVDYDPDTRLYRMMLEDGKYYELKTGEGSPGYYRVDPPGAPAWGDSIRNVGVSDEFSYTALAAYQTDDLHHHMLAFGHATPAEAIPKTGTGTYSGPIYGEGTMPATSGWGDQPYAPIGGRISFTVDFGAGTLSGLLDPIVDCDCDGPRFDDYPFSGNLTRYGFEGQFQMGADPNNYINGLFTGPAAEEAMGLWSFPLTYGPDYWVVSGAFIAKR